MAMTTEGIGHDEWRWQRIHPHDWYGDDEKRQTLQNLRASYWQAWTIQVRCDRLLGQPDNAAALLARMDGSASAFLREPGPSYWDALATLVQLYAEGKQWRQAAQKLDQMKALLAPHSDTARAAQWEALKTLLPP